MKFQKEVDEIAQFIFNNLRLPDESFEEFCRQMSVQMGLDFIEATRASVHELTDPPTGQTVEKAVGMLKNIILQLLLSDLPLKNVRVKRFVTYTEDQLKTAIKLAQETVLEDLRHEDRRAKYTPEEILAMIKLPKN